MIDFIVDSLFYGFGRLIFEAIGAFVSWLAKGGKKPFADIYEDDEWNSIRGFFTTVIVFIVWLIWHFW